MTETTLQANRIIEDAKSKGHDVSVAELNEYDYLLMKPFFQGLAPTLRIPVSTWSNKYRYLAAGASARPGLYDTANTPYLIDIMDDLGVTSTVSEIVFMKSAQVGATEAGNNWLGYIIHIAPGATLMVVPTDEMMRNNSNVRIDPMINSSPVLRSRIGRGKKDGNTTSRKKFPGGFQIYCGANSPVGLSSLPIQNLFFDETDRYPPNVGKEGSAISLGKMRTLTYEDTRKIFYVSTPTIDGISAIQKEFNNSDQRRYHVPCPECGLVQHLQFKQLKYTDNNPDTVYYECEAGCRIEEKDKRWMLDPVRAKWYATNTDFNNPRRRGYHINALYSLLGYKWSNCVRDYLEALGDDLKMCTFTNTVLGEVWKEVVDVPDWSAIYGRRMGYGFDKPPKDVSVITMGVDVQGNRLECEVVGWCKNKESYSINYHVIPGDPYSPIAWAELRKLIDTTYVREDGAVLPIRLTAVDSSGYTDAVYEFCRGYDHSKVIPIKGFQKFDAIIGTPKAIDVAPSGKTVGGSMKVWRIGTDLAKGELYGWLRQTKIDGQDTPIGYCNFPMYPETYFKMLTSEQKQIVINKKGYREYQWVLPSHVRNEALDCRVYARAAACAIGIDRWRAADWEVMRESWLPKTQKPSQGGREGGGSGGAATGSKGGFLGKGGSIW